MAADFGLPTWLLDPAEWSPLSFMGKISREWAYHRDVQFAGDVRQVGPIGLHCDGASYGSDLRAGSDASIVVCSMNFIGCADPAKKKRRHPLFVIPKAALCKCQDMCGGFHTYQAVFAVIAWSFRCMVDGHAPGTRHDDSPWSAHDRESRLARGVQLPCFALCQIRSDWAWYIEAFRFRSTSSCKCCFLCDAEKVGDMDYKDVSDEAPHRRTLMSHDEYIGSCLAAGAQPSRLFGAPGLQLHHFTVDAMHAADLGCFADFAGSVLHIEVSSKQLYRNREEGVASVNGELAIYYRARPGLTRATPLHLSQLTSQSEYPLFTCEGRGMQAFASVRA